MWDAEPIDAGYARVFQFVQGQWSQIGQDIQGENESDRMGRAVDISSDGTIIAVSADQSGQTASDGRWDYEASNGRGYACVFHLVDNTWVKLGIQMKTP